MEGTIGGGVEANVGPVGGEIKGGYNFQKDALDLKLSISVFDQKIDLIDYEIKDVAQNLMGKPLDAIGNTINNIYNYISPEAKGRLRVIEEILTLADNCKDFEGFSNIITKWGESQAAIKGNEAVYEVFRGEMGFLEVLNNQVSKNTYNIEQHDIRLNNIDKRLDNTDITLKCHKDILDDHEKRITNNEIIINAHRIMLQNHEKRIQRHEYIIGIYERRLNEHDRILSIHSSMLQNHENRLNEHAWLINNFDNILNEHGKTIKKKKKKIYELD